MKKGLLIVNTGNGKGKTTAALGLGIRALGNGLKVCLIQFIKKDKKCGEIKFLNQFKDKIDIHILGRGFTWKSDDIKKDIQVANEAWKFAKDTIAENKYQFIILDELTYLLSYKMVDEDEIINTLNHRPEGQHIIITGRDASKELIKIADTVTEMKEIKHHYNNGINAQIGIEF